MSEDSGPAAGPLVYLSGNHRAAKETVLKLLADLGWREIDVIDLGEIRSARAPKSFVLMIAPAEVGQKGGAHRADLPSLRSASAPART